MKKAAESDRTTTWWIKGDGDDVVKGLGVSVRGEWSGDCDLNDGALNSLYQEHKHRLKTIAEIGLGERGTLEEIELNLNATLHQ